MNILYVNTNQRIRLEHTVGYATHIRKTIGGFEAAGHGVIKCLAGEEGGGQGAKHAYGTMRNYLPQSISRLLRDFYEVLHDQRLYHKWLPIAEKGKIDFVYERMDPLHSCGLRLARRVGVPFVIEINDPMRETVTVNLSGLMKRYAVMLEDRLVRDSDLVILGSEELKKSYIARGFSDDKLLVLYPTADSKMFRPASQQLHLRKQFGLGEKVVLGLVAGNMSAGWRRTDLFLEAVGDLVGRNPNVAALVVGDGIPNQTLQPFPPSRPGVSLAFTGKVPYGDIPQYINAMDICVIPNATWYGSPTKLFEYGAMGKPVVASRFPPIEEIIEHEVSGLLFEPNDKADLIRQIESLLESQSRRERLGNNLREKISSLYTWERNTAAVIQAIGTRT